MIRRICLAVVFAAPLTGIGCLFAAVYEIAPFQRLREQHIAVVVVATLLLTPLFALASVYWAAHHRRRQWRVRHGLEPPQRVDRWESTREAIFAAEVVVPMYSVIPVLLGLFGMRTFEIATFVLLPMLVLGLLGRQFRSKARELDSTISDLLAKHHRPCMTCGYDLTPGNLERCPECGTPRENPR